jgi:hypothetical protein
MRSKKPILFLIILGLVLSGCSLFQTAQAPADPFKTEAYRTLSATASLYNLAWSAFEEMHDVGGIEDIDYLRGKELARKFYSTYQLAVNILADYEKTKATQGAVEAKLSLFQSANKALLEYLKPFVVKKGVQIK